MTVIKFSPMVTQVLEAANYTPVMHPNKVKTLHDIECPPGKGWVVALMGPSYFGNPATQASAQLMVDAADLGQGTTLGMQAWHVGGPGNQLSDGIEQAGYASFSRLMWLGQEAIGATYIKPDGSTSAPWTAQDNAYMAAQLELLAQTMAELKRVDGTELKWLTEAEHRQAVADYNNGSPATITGWVRHRDWTDRGLSSTSHHDTGDNYPTDVLMAKAIAYAGGTPTPEPPAQNGFLMALSDAQQQEIYDMLKALTDPNTGVVKNTQVLRQNLTAEDVMDNQAGTFAGSLGRRFSDVETLLKGHQ